MVALVVVALIGRISAALALGGTFYFADEAIYVDTARRLLAGNGFGAEYQRVPGYPVFLALLSAGLPGGLVLLRVGQGVVAALGGLLVFRLTEPLAGFRAAIVAGLIYALDPLLMVASGLLYPEAVAALLLPLSTLAACEATRRDSIAHSAMAGGFLGILILFRPVALALPPVVAGWIALTVPVRPGRRAAHAGGLVLACVLVLTPWTYRNLRVHGTLVPIAMAGTHTAPVGGERIAGHGLAASMARWTWRNPGAAATHFGREFLRFWELAPTRLTTDDPLRREALHRRDSRLPLRPLAPPRLRDLASAASFSVELLLALVGLVTLGRARPRETLLLALVVLAYASGYALFVAKLRYRIPILPLLFVFAGAGGVAIASAARRAVYGVTPGDSDWPGA